MSKHYKFGNYHRIGYMLPENIDKEFYMGILFSEARTEDVISCAIRLFMKTANDMEIDYQALVNWIEGK